MMRYLILSLCYFTLVAARPEAPVIGGPRGGFGGNGNFGAPGANLASQVAPALILLTQGNLGQAQGHSSFAGAGQAQGHSSFGGQAPAHSSFAVQAPAECCGGQAPVQQYGPPSVAQQYGAPAPPTSIVQKHIYVHVPPPDTEEDFQPAIPPPTPQKHYKIIFIKAPTSNGGQQFSPAIPPQIEEKTLVYVLVKKPERQQQFDAPVVPQSPSKPEVYFIKYRAKSAPPAQNYGPPPSQQYGAPSGSGASTSFLVQGQGSDSYNAAAAVASLGGGSLGGGSASGGSFGGVSSSGGSFGGGSYNGGSFSGGSANTAPGVDLGTIGAAASAAEGLLAGQGDPRHVGIGDGPYHKKKK